MPHKHHFPHLHVSLPSQIGILWILVKFAGRLCARLFNGLMIVLFWSCFYVTTQADFDALTIKPSLVTDLFHWAAPDAWRLDIEAVTLQKQAGNIDIIVRDLDLHKRDEFSDLRVEIPQIELRYYIEDLFLGEMFPRYLYAEQSRIAAVHHQDAPKVQMQSARRALVQDRQILRLLHWLHNPLVLSDIDSGYRIDDVSVSYLDVNRQRSFVSDEIVFTLFQTEGRIATDLGGRFNLTDVPSGMRLDDLPARASVDISYRPGLTRRYADPVIEMHVITDVPGAAQFELNLPSSLNENSQMAQQLAQNFRQAIEMRLSIAAQDRRYHAQARLNWIGEMSVDADFTYLGDLFSARDLQLNARLEQWDLLSAYPLTRLYVDNAPWAEMELSGRLDVKFRKRRFENVQLRLTGERGRLALPFHHRPVIVPAWQSTGALNWRKQNPVLRWRYVQQDTGLEAAFALRGQPRPHGNYGLLMTATAENLLFTESLNYWPDNQAAATRQWFVDHVRQGVLTTGSVEMDFLVTQDRELVFEDISGRGRLEDAVVSPDKGLPFFHHLSGDLRFDTQEFVIENITDSAKQQDAETGTAYRILPETRVRIAKQDRDVVLDAVVETDAAMPLLLDIAENYVSDFADYQETLAGIDGQTHSLMTLEVPLVRGEGSTRPPIVLAIDSEIADASFALSWFHIDEGTGRLALTHEQMALEMNMRHGESALELSWEEDFAADGERIITLSGGLDSAKLLGDSHAPLHKDFSGEITVQGFYQKPGGAAGTVALDADLYAVDVMLAPLFLTKFSGAAGAINAQGTVEADGSINLSDIAAEFAGMTAQGGMIFDSDGSIVISFPSIDWHVSNHILFDAVIAPEGDADIIIDADILDISALLSAPGFRWLNDQFGDQSKARKGDKIHLQGGSSWLLVRKIDDGEDFPLYDVTFETEFIGNLMTLANFNASYAENDSLRVAFVKDVTEQSGDFNVTVSSLENLDRIVSGNKRFGGGRLQLSSHKQSGENVYQGRLEVKRMTLYDLPFVTNILEGVSLITGNLAVLQAGYQTEGLFADFFYGGRKIIINNMRMYSLGQALTAEGVVDIADEQIDLRGSVIPLYIVTRLISKTPILGPLLIGGSQDGLLAVGYQVEGDWEDPDFDVNPLEAILPGFVRSFRNSFRSSQQEDALLQAILAEKDKADNIEQ